MLRIFPLALTVAVYVADCCPGPVDEVFLIRDPDPETQALIDACRDPVHPDCDPLCHKLIKMPDVPLEHCEMHPDNDGFMQVHVGYAGVCE